MNHSKVDPTPSEEMGRLEQEVQRINEKYDIKKKKRGGSHKYGKM